MNFRRGRAREEPEINLIPLIDILIVVLIFLFLTTTYSRFAELQINLPESAAEKSPDRPQVLAVAVDANGRYAINGATSFKATISRPGWSDARRRRVRPIRPRPLIPTRTDNPFLRKELWSHREAGGV